MKINKLLKIFITIALLVSIEVTAIAATTGVVNADTVRVREKPSTEADSDIIGLVSIGRKVTIIGEEGNWYKIKGTDDHGNKIEGYIRNDLLNVEGKATTQTPTEEPEKSEEGNNNQPTQTDNPDTNAGTTTETPAEVQNEATDANISKNDITISTIKLTEGAFAGSKTQLTEKTKIKILPSANSSNIVELQANTEVTVLEIINRWCRVETGEYAGWVRIDQ